MKELARKAQEGKIEKKKTKTQKRKEKRATNAAIRELHKLTL